MGKSKENYCSKTISCEGRTFFIEFYDDCTFHPIPYVRVYEIKKASFLGLFSFIYKDEIKGGWGMSDRVEWARQAIRDLLQEEKDYKAEWEKVFDFCKIPIDNRLEL